MPTPENPVASGQPHWVSRSAFQTVIIAFFITEIALAAVLVRGLSMWLAAPLILLTSHLMHGAAIGLHEASHGLLRRNRRFNEVDGIILGVFSLMSFSLYRVIHQSHHAHFATQRDAELWPFVLPGTSRWARILAAFLELTAGLVYTPFLFLRAFIREDSPVRNKRLRRRIWLELALMIFVWSVIFSAVAHWNLWRFLLSMYLVPAYLAANLQSWRKYIEHVGLTGHTVNGCTRSVVSPGWVGRLVAFTLLHEPLHGVHHLHAGLPHAELPRLASELQPAASDERVPYRSYRQALLDMIRSLADPRVGAQWRSENPRHPRQRRSALRT